MPIYTRPATYVASNNLSRLEDAATLTLLSFSLTLAIFLLLLDLARGLLVLEWEVACALVRAGLLADPPLVASEQDDPQPETEEDSATRNAAREGEVKGIGELSVEVERT